MKRAKMSGRPVAYDRARIRYRVASVREGRDGWAVVNAVQVSPLEDDPREYERRFRKAAGVTVSQGEIIRLNDARLN